MTKAVYQWKPRTTFKIDPQVAGEELDKIRGHNSGELSPDAVVVAAKAATSPLHSLFEWDDAKAGHEYRLTQANGLIRAIVVTVTNEGEGSRTEPLNVTVKRDTQAGGRASAQVIPPEELHRQRVERGWEELEGWCKSHKSLPEFAAVTAMLDGLLGARKREKAVAAAA